MRGVLTLMALASAVLLAGCGGSPSSPAGARATTAGGPTTHSRPCRKRMAATVRGEARLARDVRAIGRAAALPTTDRLVGNDAVNRAVDRFLLDEGTLPVDNFTRNRFINRAVALSVSACQQCFQALEAARPITQASLNQPGALPCPATRP